MTNDMKNCPYNKGEPICNHCRENECMAYVDGECGLVKAGTQPQQSTPRHETEIDTGGLI